MEPNQLSLVTLPHTLILAKTSVSRKYTQETALLCILHRIWEIISISGHI